MVEPCAAMGLTNLQAIDSVIAANQRTYESYREGIAAIDGLSILPFNAGERNNYQYVVLEVGPGFPASRDEIVETLHAENILARKYFWPGVHRMEPYRSLYPHAGLLLPNTETVASRVVVLPTGTALPADAVDTILSILRVLGQGSRN
jgi:dTDP-4-amino-4,6-dideoxygalactose transaminase